MKGFPFIDRKLIDPDITTRLDDKSTLRHASAVLLVVSHLFTDTSIQSINQAHDDGPVRQ